MGNGRSLKDVNFDKLRDVDTFSLNAAYRMYDKLDWWPTYHGCFDYVVTKSHLKNFKQLSESDNPIKRFFYLQQVSNNPRVQKITLKRNNKWNSCEADFSTFSNGGNSGVNACQVAVCLGYTKIILIGVDCNYVEIIPEAKRVDNHLKIEKLPDNNPNYWFDDYQQPGDRYNVPNTKIYHTEPWIKFSEKAKLNGIDIVNCSPVSTLECFTKSSLESQL